MTRLSIIIPCQTGCTLLDATLASVLQNRPSQSEVILVHAGAYDDPYELAGEIRILQQPENECPTRLLNTGIQAAEGEVVHFLRCGIEVEDGWADIALAALDNPAVASVAPRILTDPDSSDPIADAVDYRPGGSRREVVRGGVGPMLSAAFYRREALEAIGLLDPGVGPALADVDAALSLAAIGYRFVRVPQSRVFRQQAIEPDRESAWQHGRRQERLYWKHAAVSGGALASHTGLLLTELLGIPFAPSRALKLMGRFVSALQRAPYRQHAAAIAAADGPPVLKKTASQPHSNRRIDKPHTSAGNRAASSAEQASGS